MIRNRMLGTTSLLMSLGLAAGIAGCRVHVDKGSNGEDKNVQVDTPFGGVHVNTDQTTAADLGLPVYPGAEAVKDDDNHKSADVHLGFGEWELRVRAVSYQTQDSEEKVTVFYKKALARYGDVITCQANTPVGTPTQTSEGLTCEDNDHNASVKIDRKDFVLKLCQRPAVKGGVERVDGIAAYQIRISEREQFRKRIDARVDQL